MMSAIELKLYNKNHMELKNAPKFNYYIYRIKNYI